MVLRGVEDATLHTYWEVLCWSTDDRNKVVFENLDCLLIDVASVVVGDTPWYSMSLSLIAAVNPLEHSLSNVCILGMIPCAFSLLTSRLYTRTISPKFLFFHWIDHDCVAVQLN